MNVLLWVLQSALALLSFSGGSYKIFQFDELAKMPATAAMSREAWAALGAFEILCAVLLIAPAISKRLAPVAALAAAALAVESVALAAVYSRYSLSLAATNPLVWVAVMALMAAFVAYGRYARNRPARDAAAVRER